MDYTLMHRTIPVLEMELDDDLGVILKVNSVLNAQHIPVGVSVKNDSADRYTLNKWWSRRAIPASRSGLRDALEKLEIPFVQALVKECYGLSLSDQYWICPQNSSLKWENVNFFDNAFSEDIGNILFGGETSGDKPDLISPDSTSDGWLKKKWKIIDGRRCLVKGGSMPFHQEPLNEVFASAVCRRLNIPHVDYTLLWEDEIPYSVCEDFITNKTDLVNAWQICKTKPLPESAELYDHFITCCGALDLSDPAGYLDKMLTLDYLIVNTDRHFGNFGAVRYAETLEWLGMAPVYDTGTSFWHNTANAYINPGTNVESATFRKKHSEQLELIRSFKWLDLSSLNGIVDEIYSIYSPSPHMNEERCNFLSYAFRRRIELLDRHIRSRNPQYAVSYFEPQNEDEEHFEP